MNVIGTICGIGSLAVIIAVAACTILMRFMGMENEIFAAITWYGPGVATVFGTISTGLGYYSYFLILRRKKKFSKKDEAKGEAKSQLEEFIQSLPDMFSSMSSGCFSQVSTIALGASLVASTATYTPVGEMAVEAVKSFISKEETDTKKTAEEMKIIMEETSEEQREEIKEEAEPEIEEEKKPEQKIEKFEKFEKFESSEDVIEGRRGWSTEGKYVIQVQTFSQLANAEKVAEELVKRGINAYVAKVKDPAEFNGVKYRVRVGNFGTIPEAKSYAARVLNPIGRKGWWVDFRRNDNVGKPAGYKAPLSEPEFTELTEFSEYKVPQEPVVLQKPSPPPQPQPPPPQPQPEPQVASQTQPKPQPKKSGAGFFAGVGSEVNSNAKKGTAVGGNMAMGLDFNKHFAMGVNAVYSNDMEASASTVESTVMFRYYLPASGPFIQAEAGGALNPEEKSSATPMGGVAAGLRLDVNQGWFVEPAVRGGYPFVWGTGITVGKKFGD
jgi:cell division septation protein DedD